MDDPMLAMAVRDKLQTIARELDAHGFPVVDPSLADARSEAVALRDRTATLEQELDFERKSRDPLEVRVKELTAELERDRQWRLNTLARVLKLSAQLDRAKATQEQLFAASRQCIVSLRAMRQQLRGVPFAARSMSPLVHDVKGLVDLIQELRSLSSIRSAADDFVTR
ncbi:MAG TPA: hypothetical protein VF992_01000 [Thermoplasmata archaeon]